MRENKGKIFWGVLFVIVGGILLLNNFGLLPGNTLMVLIKLWPLLIVFSGLEMFFGSSDLAEFLLTLLIVLIIGYIIVQYFGDLFPWFPFREQLRNFFQ